MSTAARRGALAPARAGHELTALAGGAVAQEREELVTFMRRRLPGLRELVRIGGL